MQLINKTLYFWHEKGGFQAARIVAFRTNKRQELTSITVKRHHGAKPRKLKPEAWVNRPEVCGLLFRGKIRRVPVTMNSH